MNFTVFTSVFIYSSYAFLYPLDPLALTESKEVKEHSLHIPRAPPKLERVAGT